MAADWSQEEISAAVADYFDMFDRELRGLPYSKSEHKRALVGLLDGRTVASAEYKHSNISAVLVDLGYPYLRGYKPLHNYQRALVDEVARRLANGGDLRRLLADSADSIPTAASDGDPDRLLVDPPVRAEQPGRVAREAVAQWRGALGVDYCEREARNSALGRAGEELVVEFERARLVRAGAPDCAQRVEQVSVSLGDGLGYDVRSFSPDRSERFIEVKTTRHGKFTPFFLSPNELSVSRRESRRYFLYRVFDFDFDPRLFQLEGALDTLCSLEPSQYLARVGYSHGTSRS